MLGVFDLLLISFQKSKWVGLYHHAPYCSKNVASFPAEGRPIAEIHGIALGRPQTYWIISIERVSLARSQAIGITETLISGR